MRKITLVAATLFWTLPAAALPPGMGQKCNTEYERYASKQGPKAFAISRGDACGWRSLAPGSSMQEVKRRAIGYCIAAGGKGCRVVESEAH